MKGWKDCPHCGARMSVDPDLFCNACGQMLLFALGDIVNLGGPSSYLVTQIKAGKVVLEKILTQGPD